MTLIKEIPKVSRVEDPDFSPLKKPFLPCAKDVTNHTFNVRLYTKKWSQFWICLTASFITFLTGLFFGFISPTIAQLADPWSPIAATQQDIHLIAIIPPIGKFLGPLFFTFFLNSIGRKKTALLTLLPFCFGSAMIYAATNITTFMLGEFFIGISTYAIPVVSVYIVEVSAIHLRDTFGCLVVFQISLGGITGYILASLLPLRTMALIMTVLPLVVLLVASWCPESPYFYLKRRNISSARKSLSHLYESNLVEAELNRLIKAVEDAEISTQGTFKGLFTNITNNRNFKSLMMLCGIFFIHYFAGQVVVILYFPTFLKQSTPTLVSNDFGGFLIGLSQPLSMFLSIGLTRVFDKKNLLVLSCTLSSLPMFALVLFHYFNNCQTNDSCQSNVPMISMIVFLFTNSLGLLTLPWVYFRELVPLNYVAKFALIVDLLLPFLQAFAIVVFNFVSSTFGYEYAFLVFFVNLICGAVIFYNVLPETRNKTLEHIQESL